MFLNVFAYVCCILSNNFLYSLMSISLKVVIYNYDIYFVLLKFLNCVMFILEN